MEERSAAVEHDHAVAALERRAVRLQAALEGIEAGVAVGGLAIDARGLRVALAAQLLRVAFGLGQDHGAFAIGLGADRLRLLLALGAQRSEEHTSELQSLMRLSYAVFCLKTK